MMETDTAMETVAAPAAPAELFRHEFNEAGVCEAPEVVVLEMPKHFAAEIRLALAPDGWRVGFEYEGPPVGVGMRGVLPSLADAAFEERVVALRVGCRQLIAALEGKPRARKAAGMVLAFLVANGGEAPAESSDEGRESSAEEPPPAAPTLQVLGLGDVALDSANPRKSFSAEDLEELAESIARNGILQPLVVRALRPDEMEDRGTLLFGLGARFVVVAGERRYRAAGLLAQRFKAPVLPCVVYEQLTPSQALLIALTENLQREGMNPIEEAEGFDRLLKYGFTQQEIAEKVGKSRPVIANALRLLALPESVREILRSGQLTTAHGVALARFKAWPKIAARIAELAIEKKTPAGELEHGVPYDFKLHQEKLIEPLNYSDDVEDALGVDNLEYNDDGVPEILVGKPWLLVEKNPDCAEADMWVMDVPAWEAFCGTSQAEQQAKKQAAYEALPGKAGKPAGPVLDLAKLDYKEYKKVEDLPAAVRKAISPELIERGDYYGARNIPVVRGETLALANKLERAATIEANRAKRQELDGAWTAAVAKIAKIDTVSGDHVAQLLEWCCSDWQVGSRDDNVTEAADALKLELPKGVKVIGRGAAEKLSRYTPVQLLRLIFAIRARAAWRVAHRDASPLPDDLKLFGATPAAKPAKKPAKAKKLKKAA